MGRPHALVIPFPAQGHVRPLMELSHRLADRGFTVTFVNTEHVHERVTAALPENFSSDYGGRIRFATIPDGMDPGEDRCDFLKFTQVIHRATVRPLEELILKINAEEEEGIACVIADGMAGWLLPVAKKLGIRTAAFWPASAWFLAIVLEIPSLIEKGVIDQRGFPKDNEPITISDKIPAINPAHLCWLCLHDPQVQENSFKLKCITSHVLRDVDHIICNSFLELEAPVFEHAGNALPIGPLVSAAGRIGHQPFSFWQEDPSCLSWLDEQPSRSVVYVAFGSYTLMNRRQIHELARGLELSGLPFLWVSRPDLMGGSAPAYPDGFMDVVAGRGRLVGWSPQQEVLSHPSIACFVSHCGWNSTMEGLWNGVPMLCWPYFADQYQNQTYVVEVWRVGLELRRDREGIVETEEIVGKLKELLKDEGINKRVGDLKDKARKCVEEGGNSFKNFDDFICAIKEYE
ncbi:UDP-glycosyltransferase 83A1-like [Nymphaea colorata]|nr:UDP-glycosyltransferase 83A1-like [Nymphaea colorata]